MSKPLKLNPRPTFLALLATLLFGSSTPLAKMMLGSVGPLLLAGLLYLGAGLGMSLYYLADRSFKKRSPEARLALRDMPWLFSALVVGGILAPAILMFSLDVTQASTASLLLNFESVGTVLIAWLMFREEIGTKVWAALVLVLAGSISLSVDWGGGWGISIGAVGILLACVLWGLDNNLMRKVSAKDPVATVAIKGTLAGTIMIVGALMTGSRFPVLDKVLLMLLLGFICYGISIVFYLKAMREMGAARTGVIFGSAPFFGVALGILMFRDRIGPAFILSLSLMVIGTVLIFTESHSHEHIHEGISHEHRHAHDDGHHDHHRASIGPHSHPHEHRTVRHTHRHFPDLHHRHGH